MVGVVLHAYHGSRRASRPKWSDEEQRVEYSCRGRPGRNSKRVAGTIRYRKEMELNGLAGRGKGNGIGSEASVVYVTGLDPTLRLCVQ